MASSSPFSPPPLFLMVNFHIISRVTDVSFMIDSLPVLRVLDLGRNLIQDIPFGALRNTKHLSIWSYFI